MANVIAGGLFNTVAFPGVGYRFSKLNHRGYSEEIKRHNLALEKLAEEKQESYERGHKKGHIAQLERQLQKANQDIT